jgi:hypothetical protein
VRAGPGGRRFPVRAVGWLLLPLALVACGGGKKNNPSGPTSDEMQFLLQHNARFNDGQTVRWPNLPIRVFTNGIAQEGEVTEWTRATGGKVTFTFVGSAGGADITFRFGGSESEDICGVTTVTYNGDGTITSADTRVVQSIYRGPQCQRTIVHEVGHGIGFLDHTADSGLMDPDGGNGVITEPVSTMLRNLYSLAPGTFIGNAQTAREVRRGGGRYTVTIVDPVRR